MDLFIAMVAMETIFAMENVSKVIRVLSHSNQSIVTITMGQNTINLPKKQFPRLNSKSVRHLSQ